MVGWGGGGGEKLGIKLKLSFSWGLGLAELGKNKNELCNSSSVLCLLEQVQPLLVGAVCFPKKDLTYVQLADN